VRERAPDRRFSGVVGVDGQLDFTAAIDLLEPARCQGEKPRARDLGLRARYSNRDAA
jgi:hypothetical protein